MPGSKAEPGDGTTGSGERSRAALWLLLPSAALYVLTFLIPLAVVVVFSFASYHAGVTTLGHSLDNYREIFADGVTLGIFTHTIKLAIAITLICLVVGYPVAITMRRARPRVRLVLLVLIVSPLLTSVIVRNVAWLLILGRTGLINQALVDLGLVSTPLPLMYNDLGVVIAVVHVYLSFMVLPIFASLNAIEPSIEESAASLGATAWRTFVHVTLPLSLPGIAAGSTIVFILSMGIYLTPVIMGGNFVVTVPMVITDLVHNQFNWANASALAVALLVFIGAAASAFNAILRQRHAAP
jgi:putative spermidine/putrescine transport system permease protein